MANQIIGRILYIYPTEEIKSKDGSKTLQKRPIVLDCTRFDPYTGERGYENVPMLEFTGDRCAELDKFQAEQIVSISFDVQGTRYRDQDGKERIFTRVSPYRIELRQANQQPPQTQQPSGAVAQQAPPPPTNPTDDLPF